MNLAILEAEAGNLAAGEARLIKIKLIKPQDARAYYNLGVIYNMKGEKQKALGEFKAALERDASYSAELTPLIKSLSEGR